MKNLFFVFFLLIAQTIQADERWLPGFVILQSDDTLRGEIRNRQFFNDELTLRIEGDKQRFNPEEVKEFQVNNKKWISLNLSLEMDQEIFAEETKPGLYKTFLREVKCACDNSYQNRKVWIWQSFSEQYVFKKRLLNRQIKNWNELRDRIIADFKLTEEDLPRQLMFDDVPELTELLKKIG